VIYPILRSASLTGRREAGGAHREDSLRGEMPVTPVPQKNSIPADNTWAQTNTMVRCGMSAESASGYLDHTFFIDCDHETVREKGRGLTAGSEGVKERAIRLFSFVRDEIRYNIYATRDIDADFKASRVLARKEGYCVQKAVLLVALARAVGIPARLRFAEVRSHLTAADIVAKRGSNVFLYHGLTDLYIEGRWVKATPTYDLEYCKRMGIAPIRFDAEEDAMLPAYTEDGRLNAEYLQDRGFFDDLPIDEIRKASLSGKYVKR